MLGEKEKETLRSYKLLGLFHQCERELIDFVLKTNRLPHYTKERKHYRTYLRLKKKLNRSRETLLILTSLFSAFNSMEVLSKSTGGIDS